MEVVELVEEDDDDVRPVPASVPVLLCELLLVAACRDVAVSVDRLDAAV